MLLTGDLGFQSLVLVICFVVPVISFFIQRKWRLAVARQEEIKRLLVLASEEAARAEIEASVGYSVVSTVPRYYECPVCYSPATTRCSQCKSVRYWYVILNLLIYLYGLKFANSVSWLRNCLGFSVFIL